MDLDVGESISPRNTELPLQSDYVCLSPKDSRLTLNVQLTSSRQVRLDVGGYKYSTTLTTLTADPNSMLAAMFSGRFPVEKNEEGCVFIDRDGRYFHHILNWLRNGTLPPLETNGEQESLLMEAKYYQISSLVEFLGVDDPLHPPVESTGLPTAEKFSLKEILLLVNSVPSKKKVQLPSTDLNHMTLDGIHLPGANLKFANLEGSSLRYANLQEVCMECARLSHADLQFADLSLGNLQNCILQSAKLNNANLQGANLQGAYLANCDLQGANLQGANLQGAILQGANVQHTNLLGAKLQGASLHGIANVQHAKGLKR